MRKAIAAKGGLAASVLRAAALCALPVSAPAAFADPPGAGRAAPLPAVGRISYGDHPALGAPLCSATLVAPDLILTAGHCVRDTAPQALRFRAGYRHGAFAAEARGAAVIRPLLPGGLAGDLALVRLDLPIPPGAAAPLALAPRTAQGLRMIAYRRDMPEMRSDGACGVLLQRGATLGLDCSAVSGNSGAPLLQRGDAGWQVVAVMVAQDRQGRIVRSYAVVPPADLAAEIAPPR